MPKKPTPTLAVKPSVQCGWCRTDIEHGQTCGRCRAALDLETPIVVAAPRTGWLLVRVRMRRDEKEPWLAEAPPGVLGTGLHDCMMGVIVVGQAPNEYSHEWPLHQGTWVMFDPMRWSRPGISAAHADRAHLWVPTSSVVARLLI